MTATETIDQQELFENIFTHAYNGIAIVGLDGSFQQVNDGLCRILGYEQSELKKLTFQEITHPEDLSKDLQLLEKLQLGTIENYQIEKRYIHKTGTVVWVLLSVSVVLEKNGRPIHFVSQIIDITKRKNIEQVSESFLTLLEDQNSRFKDFTDIVSHDLRTHIGNIATLAQFLEEEHNHLHTNENFSLIKLSIENLNETLSSLNETIKINRLTKKNLEPISLKKKVDKAFDSTRAIAKVDGCKLINNIPDTMFVLADRTYLSSILINFISNAIKYRDPIRNCTIVLSAIEKEKFIILKIEDNGLGIDLKKFGEALFTPYATFHNRSDARGVGLYITKKYVELLGGSIHVESIPNVGSTFFVRLPMAIVA